MSMKFEEVAAATRDFDPDTIDGMIRMKSYAYMFEIQGELGQVCQVDGQPPGSHSVAVPAPVMYQIRQITKYTYRWASYNQPSVIEHPQAPYNPGWLISEDTATVGVPGVKAYQTAFHDTAGAMALESRQGVNIQPAFGCDGNPFVPSVRIDEDQLPLPVDQV